MKTATPRMLIWTQKSATGDFIRANREMIKACTDLGDGGLALAAFELAEAAGVGISLDDADRPSSCSAKIRPAIWSPATSIRPRR